MDPIDLTSLDIAVQQSSSSSDDKRTKNADAIAANENDNEMASKDVSDSNEDNAESPPSGDAELSTAINAVGDDSSRDFDGKSDQSANNLESMNELLNEAQGTDSVGYLDASLDASSEESGDSTSGIDADQSESGELQQSEEAENASVETSTNSTSQTTTNVTAIDEQPNTQEIINSTTNTSQTTATDDDEEDDEQDPPPQTLVNYASKVSGAQILEKSPSLKGTSNLLTDSLDHYAIAPCQDKKYVVIGLSEDILVKIVKLANYERYSSHVKEFQILASQEYPTQEWTDIGTYTALSKSGEQTFELKEAAWARYLKFKFLSHYGVEHYCTVSQIRVHGSTMLQGFHEQWIESEKMDEEMGGEMEEGDEGDGDGGEGEDQEEEQGHDGTKQMVQGQSDEVQDSLEEATSSGEIDVANSDADMDLHDSEQSTHDTENVEASADSHNAYEESTHHEETHREEDDEPVSSDETETGVEDNSIDEHVDVRGSEDIIVKDRVKADDESTVQESEISETDMVELSEEAETDNVIVNSQGQVVLDDSAPSSEELDDDSQPSSEEDDQTQENITLPDNSSLSESTEHTVADGEVNSSMNVVADAVKAAVAHVTDELKHVKEAVQSTDAVTEIKKIIRTTIAVTEEEGVTELDIVYDSNIDEIVQQSEIPKIDEQVEITEPDPDAKRSVISTPTLNDTVVVNETETSNDKNVLDGNCTNNSTDTVTPIEHEDNTTDVVTKDVGIADGESKAENTSAKDPAVKIEETVAQTPNSTRKHKSGQDVKTKTQSNTSSLKVEPTATLPKRDAINRSAEDHITELLSRYPSSSCIKDLDFRAFKTKSLMANVAGAAIGGAKMEPIFQKITSEIKSVQTTQHQYEQFVSAIKNCYEKVLSDMANDIDAIQSKFDSRLTVLEMMLLERNENRQSQSPTFFSFPVIVLAYLPSLANLYSIDGTLYCLLIAGFVIVMLRRKSKRNTRSSDVVINNLDTSSSTHEVNEQPSVNFEHVIRHPNNVAPELFTHEISCEESVESNTPSLPRSEPSGTPISSSTPLLIREVQRGKFRIRKRAKSDGMKYGVKTT